MTRPKPGTYASLSCLVIVGGLTSLPILTLSVGGPSPPDCDEPQEIVDDGTPSILGPARLTVADLGAWWAATGRGQPTRLRVAVEDLIAVYLAEGDAEGVRGDLALAQAVLETGYFTNSDTVINNFAGIAHYDGSPSGSAFADPIVGVRSQVQLLKKYALGNDAQLAHRDVAPRARASATTWGALAGTWATDTDYWTKINRIYRSMLGHAGSAPPQIDPFAPLRPGLCSGGDLSISGGYALPVDRRWYDEHPDWFTRPHHDYPAIDIPVPIGTPLYAMTDGVVVATPTSGRCGIGVVLNGDDRAQYVYCHGRPGSQVVTIGQRVTAGQYLLDSASTGNSRGPHLHLSVEIDGTKRCPQSLLMSTAEGQPVSLDGLPSSGCIS